MALKKKLPTGETLTAFVSTQSDQNNHYLEIEFSAIDRVGKRINFANVNNFANATKYPGIDSLQAAIDVAIKNAGFFFKEANLSDGCITPVYTHPTLKGKGRIEAVATAILVNQFHFKETELQEGLNTSIGTPSAIDPSRFSAPADKPNPINLKTLTTTIEDMVITAYGPPTRNETMTEEEKKALAKAMKLADDITKALKQQLGITGVDSPGPGA